MMKYTINSTYTSYKLEDNLPLLTQKMLVDRDIQELGLDTAARSGFKREGDPIYLIHLPEGSMSDDIMRGDGVDSIIPVSRGGLYIALARAAMAGNFGFAVETVPSSTVTRDLFLFGEPEKIGEYFIISVHADRQLHWEQEAQAKNSELQPLGVVTKNGFVVDGELFDTVGHAQDVFNSR